MFQEILVPLDFTAKNRAAVDAALALAHQDRAKTTLLHVVYSPSPATRGELRSFYEELEARAKKKLATHAKAFHRLGLVVREKVVTGDVLDLVLKESKKADLVVLASHQIKKKPGLHDWGTVSYKVAVLCDCPVLLVK